MSDNIFDTVSLIQIVPNLFTSQNFLLDMFFTNIVESEDEYVAIDVEVGQRRMAPFCSPLVEGKLVEGRRVQTNKFKPAYIKDKRAPDLLRPIRRQIGERVGGNQMTVSERAELNLMYEMSDSIDMINRRMEWMASQALQSGTVTIVGDGFPTTLVDFGRDSSLTQILSGTDIWPTSLPANATNTLPSDDIEAWQALILQKSGGVATDLIFTNAAWKAFKKDTDVKATGIVMPGLSPFGNAVDAGAKITRGAVYKGKWGQYNLWLYNDWYIDPVDGVEKPMIPDGGFIMTGADLMGTRAFGAILDPEFDYGPMAYAPKSWVVKDPAQRMLMTQSSPIVIPSRVNASLYAKVC